jgi:hypothetical protein
MSGGRIAPLDACGRALEGTKGPRYSLLVPARRSALDATALALALAALTVAGCGNGAGADPQPLPPITQSPTASPSPTATKDDLQQSAEQFIRAYFREFDRANHTSDPSRLERAYYADDCQPCKDDVKVINSERHKNRRIDGYEFLIRDIRVDEANTESALVSVVVHHRSGRIVRIEDGAVMERLSATKPVQSLFDLRRVDNDWRITRITSLGAVTP